MTKQVKVTAPWHALVKGWSKAWGTCPTALMFTVAAAFAARGFGKQSVSLAQALRPEGCTEPQMRDAGKAFDELIAGMAMGGGTTSKNHFKPLERAGELVSVHGAGSAWRGCQLTVKGAAKIALKLGVPVADLATLTAAPSKAPTATAKGKGKPQVKRAPKVKPATVDAPVATPEVIDVMPVDHTPPVDGATVN